MNRGDDRPAHVRNLLHLGHDDERGAGVQTARGLVQEENRRVGDELDGDGEHLALAGRQTVGAPALPDHASRDGPQLQDIQRLLHEPPSLGRGHLGA